MGALFADLKINTKIRLGFTAVLALLVMAAAASVFSLLSIRTAVGEFSQRVLVVVIAGQLDQEVLDLRRQVREFALTGDPSPPTPGAMSGWRRFPSSWKPI